MIGIRATGVVLVATTTVAEMAIYFRALVAWHLLAVAAVELTRVIAGFASVARTTRTTALCSPSSESSYYVAARRLGHLPRPRIAAAQCHLHAPHHSSAGSPSPSLHFSLDYSLLDHPRSCSSVFPWVAAGLTIARQSTTTTILAG